MHFLRLVFVCDEGGDDFFYLGVALFEVVFELPALIICPDDFVPVTQQADQILIDFGNFICGDVVGK